MSTKSGTYETCASYSNPSIVSRIHKIRTMGLVASEITSYKPTTINATKILSDVPPIILLDTTRGTKKSLDSMVGDSHIMTESKNFLRGPVNIFLCYFYIYYQILKKNNGKFQKLRRPWSNLWPHQRVLKKYYVHKFL